jgi:uncharacterized protein YggE
MTIENGILRVTTTETLDVEATRAKLHVRVEGETFAFGNAALQRSREIAELVSRLKTLGVADEDVSVKGVNAKMQQGTFMKGTRVSFSLVINIKTLEMLPDVLGVITTAKHAELERLEWVFEDEAARLELAAQAMKKALGKATIMANAVSHEISGIRAVSDSSTMPDAKGVAFGGDWVTEERQRAATMKRIDVGTEFKASREISATVTVDFVIVKTTS